MGGTRPVLNSLAQPDRKAGAFFDRRRQNFIAGGQFSVVFERGVTVFQLVLAEFLNRVAKLSLVIAQIGRPAGHNDRR